MSKKKVITLLLTLAMILSLSVDVSAAETTEAKVPITLTVVNTVTPISCTVPACLPVSLVDGYVVTANNALPRKGVRKRGCHQRRCGNRRVYDCCRHGGGLKHENEKICSFDAHPLHDALPEHFGVCGQ